MKRLLIAIVALAPFAIVAATACTEGTTPDCSLPGTQCAPDLDGSFPDVARDGTSDAPDDVTPSDTGAGDADAGDAADAPRDARLDSDAAG